MIWTVCLYHHVANIELTEFRYLVLLANHQTISSQFSPIIIKNNNNELTHGYLSILCALKKLQKRYNVQLLEMHITKLFPSPPFQKARLTIILAICSDKEQCILTVDVFIPFPLWRGEGWDHFLICVLLVWGPYPAGATPGLVLKGYTVLGWNWAAHMQFEAIFSAYIYVCVVGWGRGSDVPEVLRGAQETLSAVFWGPCRAGNRSQAFPNFEAFHSSFSFIFTIKRGPFSLFQFTFHTLFFSLLPGFSIPQALCPFFVLWCFHLT